MSIKRTLWERFQAESIWSRLGIIGSLASILALFIAMLPAIWSSDAQFPVRVTLAVENPFTYVLLLAVVTAWVCRQYFVRTHKFLATLDSLPTTDRLQGLQMLALGYPETLTKSHLEMMRLRYDFAARAITVVCGIALAALLVYYFHISPDAIRAIQRQPSPESGTKDKPAPNKSPETNGRSATDIISKLGEPLNADQDRHDAHFDLKPLRLETSTAGRIGQRGQVDAYEIGLKQGQRVFLEIIRIGSEYTDTDQTLVFEMRAPSNRNVLRTTSTWSSLTRGMLGRVGERTEQLTESGRYTLYVHGNGNDTATYEFALYEVEEREPARIALGTTVSGEIRKPGQCDQYAIDLAEGQGLFFSITQMTSRYANIDQTLVFVMRTPNNRNLFWTTSTWSSLLNGMLAPVDKRTERLPESGRYILSVYGQINDQAGYSFSFSRQ